MEPGLGKGRLTQEIWVGVQHVGDLGRGRLIQGLLGRGRSIRGILTLWELEGQVSTWGPENGQVNTGVPDDLCSVHVDIGEPGGGAGQHRWASGGGGQHRGYWEGQVRRTHPCVDLPIPWSPSPGPPVLTYPTRDNLSQPMSPGPVLTSPCLRSTCVELPLPTSPVLTCPLSRPP